MKVIGNNVILREDEVSVACPHDTSWGAAMVRIYGPDTGFKGRLKILSKCPKVITDAGYKVTVVKSADEEARLAERLEVED